MISREVLDELLQRGRKILGPDARAVDCLVCSDTGIVRRDGYGPDVGAACSFCPRGAAGGEGL